jgi:DNA-binding response OmpR family regulator
MKLLSVEDDVPLGLAPKNSLESNGYNVTWVRTAEDARRFLSAEQFDLLLIDIVLPHESGLDLVVWCRQLRIDTSVMMLTARDYLAKPFALEELLSRMRALLRRSTSQRSSVWSIGRLSIDTVGRRVSRGAETVNLSRREYDLLLKLATSPGRVLTRIQLARGSAAEGASDSNAVDVQIYSLRKKLGPEFISTVRGVGYALEEVA